MYNAEIYRIAKACPQKIGMPLVWLKIENQSLDLNEDR